MSSLLRKEMVPLEQCQNATNNSAIDPGVYQQTNVWLQTEQNTGICFFPNLIISSTLDDPLWKALLSKYLLQTQVVKSKNTWRKWKLLKTCVSVPTLISRYESKHAQIDKIASIPHWTLPTLMISAWSLQKYGSDFVVLSSKTIYILRTAVCVTLPVVCNYNRVWSSRTKHK